MPNTYLNEASKLNGESYVDWNFKLLIVLEGINLLSIVNGDEAKPNGITATIIHWEKRESKAKVLLRMSVKDNIILHTRDYKTSKETWDVLKELYETMNANLILYQKSKLMSIKMETHENITAYISRIKDLSDQLGAIGKKVLNTDLVMITLKGLLKDYQVFISSLVAREKPPTFTKYTGILLQEEERMKTFDLDTSSSDLELVVKGKQPYRGKPLDKSKGGKFQEKKKGIASSKFESNVKKNDECF